MELKVPVGAAVTARFPVNWFPIIFLAAFLAITSMLAAADAQSSAEELSPAEQWVVARVTAGETANLDAALNADHTKKFPEEKDRKLRARFLQELLTGTLPDVQPQRIGVRIVGATIDESIDISNAQIPWDIWLEYCQFMRSATIHHASFAWNVSFEYSTFKDVADFDHIRVGHLVSFHNAVFEGRVNFSSADIANNFEAHGARFQKDGAFFGGMKVGGAALFDNAEFEGPVNFSYANIANNFEAPRAKFPKSGAVFSGMKVGGDAIFEQAKFEGRTDFSYANIANNFNANEAKFENEKNGAVFSGMKVGGDATFYSAVFQGPVRFNYADFARLSLSCPFLPTVAAQFHMQGMSYKYIRAVPQPEPSPGSHTTQLLLYSLSPEPPASFRVVPPQPKPFPRSHTIPPRLAPLYLEVPASFRVVPQPKPSPGSHITPLRLDPLYLEVPASFRPVSQPEPESESREALLQLADMSAYSADVYSRLEQFFLGQGYRVDSDEAFMAGKRRERKEYFRSGHWVGWLRSWMLYLLVGYGRQPWRAGIPCAVLVALGCVLFSPQKMKPQKPEDTPRVYSRFWYSLGLFLPFVDLQADKVWKPKADQTFLRNYMRVHILLGWILVPLVLAALTGLIK